MSATNRAALIAKTFKTLKKKYNPILPVNDRPLLDQLLFASCLENSDYEAAQEAFSAVLNEYFDLNEVRVTSVAELSEVMKNLYDPKAAAANLKNILQSVFEDAYSYDLEHLKKMNLGAAVKILEKHKGTTPFIVSYAVQHSLGGHSIPLDKAALLTLYVLGIANEKEAASGAISGMIRAIPKSSGVEFGSLLHQPAAAFLAKSFNADIRNFLLTISPDAKERFPKRAGRKTKKVEEEPVKDTKKKKVTAKKVTAKKVTATATKKKTKTAVKKKAAKVAVKKKPAKKTVKKKRKTVTKKITRKKPR